MKTRSYIRTEELKYIDNTTQLMDGIQKLLNDYPSYELVNVIHRFERVFWVILQTRK